MGIFIKASKDSPFGGDDSVSASYHGWHAFLEKFAPNFLAKYGADHRDLAGIQNAGPILPDRRQELLNDLLSYGPDDLGDFLGHGGGGGKDLGEWSGFYKKLIRILRSPDAYQG